MIHVHKRAGSPLDPWSVLKTVGPNTIAPKCKSPYLILWNVESVRRDGVWHYVLDFEPRETTEVNPVARRMGHPMQRYPDGPDWRQWFGDGEDWGLIDEHTRWQLLQSEPARRTSPLVPQDVKISMLKVGTAKPVVTVGV